MDIKDFCSEYGLESIVWVDDEHASLELVSIEGILSILAEQYLEADSNTKKSVQGVFIQNLEEENIPTVKQMFTQLVETQDVASFEDRVVTLLNLADDARGIAKQALDSLGSSLPSQEDIDKVETYLGLGGDIEKYSFTEWHAQSKEIIDSIKSRKNKKLLLLDLQNTRDIGVTLGNEGMKILEDISREDISDELIIIVLTSLVGREKELKFGRELSNRFYPASELPISVLSKTSGFGSNATKALEEVFHRIVLVRAYSELKKRMSEKYKESIDNVFSELKPITIEELVWCVARASDEDGVSEFDALMRVIDHQAKINFKSSILNDNDLKELIFRCRKFDTEIEKRTDIDKKAVAKFHLSEIFESVEPLNQLHSQVSVGDIFEIGSDQDKELYVLIGNICNTALRGNSGERKYKSALLFPLKQRKNSSPNLIEVGPCYKFSDYFGNEGTIAIDITEPITLPYKYLDLCWIRNDGKCSVFSKRDIKNLIASGALTRAQKKRVEQMASDPVKQEELKKPIVRVARLSQSKIFEIMQSYSRRLSVLPRDVSFLN